MSIYKNKNQARGATFFMILFFTAFALCSLWLGSKIGGMYWERYLLQKTLQQVAADPSAAKRTAQETFNAIQKRIEVQNIVISAENFELDATRNPKIIKVYFKKDVELTNFLTVTGESWLTAPIKSSE